MGFLHRLEKVNKLSPEILSSWNVKAPNFFCTPQLYANWMQPENWRPHKIQFSFKCSDISKVWIVHTPLCTLVSFCWLTKTSNLICCFQLTNTDWKTLQLKPVKLVWLSYESICVYIFFFFFYSWLSSPRGIIAVLSSPFFFFNFTTCQLYCLLLEVFFFFSL